VILEDFDAARFARAELAADPYCDPRALGAQIARAASERGGRYFGATDLPSACVCSPPAGYDASEKAAERRMLEGEESERDYEAARFADDERAGEYDLSAEED
jgi:hypothetical protein